MSEIYDRETSVMTGYREMQFDLERWEDSYCPGCGQNSCIGECDLYDDWEHDFTNPFFEPRRKREEYAEDPLRDNPYLKAGSE